MTLLCLDSCPGTTGSLPECTPSEPTKMNIDNGVHAGETVEVNKVCYPLFFICLGLLIIVILELGGDQYICCME